MCVCASVRYVSVFSHESVCHCVTRYAPCLCLHMCKLVEVLRKGPGRQQDSAQLWSSTLALQHLVKKCYKVVSKGSLCSLHISCPGLAVMCALCPSFLAGGELSLIAPYCESWCQ